MSRTVGDAYLGTQLSTHKVRSETDGSLICRAIVARSGFQNYKMSELEESSGSNEIVSVFRPPEEVLSPQFLASLEGAALTENHPSSFVNPDNHSWVSRGFAVNARRGPNDAHGNVTVEMDLHLKDRALIDSVNGGKCALSCGYLYQLESENGRMVMRNLKANHIAIVDNARAGEVAQIMDAMPESLGYSGPTLSPRVVQPTPQIVGANFEDVCRVYHRRDPLSVAQDELPHSDNTESPMLRTRTEDVGVIETARTGASVGRRIASGNTEDEENMPEKKCTCGADEDERHLRRCPLYEEVAAGEDEGPEQFNEPVTTPGPELIPVAGGGNAGNVNPTARDSYQRNLQALDNLQALRPAIVAHAKRTSDQAAVKTWNRALVGLKREIAVFEEIHGTGLRMLPYESQQPRVAHDAAARQRDIAAEFEASVKQARESQLNDNHGFKRNRRGSRVAADAEPEDVGFDEQVRRARAKMLR
jgi:hypothetical protein